MKFARPLCQWRLNLQLTKPRTLEELIFAQLVDKFAPAYTARWFTLLYKNPILDPMLNVEWRPVYTLHIFQVYINSKAIRDSVAALVSGLQSVLDWNSC
jgi:hypothetical protein